MSAESRVRHAEHANKPERVGEVIALRKHGMLVKDIADTVFPGVPDKVLRVERIMAKLPRRLRHMAGTLAGRAPLKGGSARAND